MICPKCGADETSQHTYCTKCGAALSPAPAEAVVSKKLKKGWIVGVSMGMVVLIAVMILFFVLHQSKNSSDSFALECGNFSFTYGMTVDRDALLEDYEAEQIQNNVLRLKSGDNLLLREDESTGTWYVVAMITRTSELGGLRIGDSTDKVFERYPEMRGSAESSGSYTLYYYEGQVYTPETYQQLLRDVQNNGEAVQEMKTEVKMYSVLMKENAVAAIFYGDVQALTMMR